MAKIEDSNRIIIKIGRSHAFDVKKMTPNFGWINSLIDDVVELKKRGKEVIIVSSGAIVLGCHSLGLKLSKTKLFDKQVASTVGQSQLMQIYRDAFAKHGIEVAQLLLTIEDVENRKHFLSARNIIGDLLKRGIVPIINQNDLIATAEIRFGDNDRLAARVAQMSNSDLLILLSNIDGFYTADPADDPNAEFIKDVFEINTEIERLAGDSILGTGGMSAKLAAVKIAINAHCDTIISSGAKENPIKFIFDGGKCTRFLASDKSHQKYVKE